MRSSVLLVILLVLLPFIFARSPARLRFSDEVTPSSVSDEAGGPIPFVSATPATSAPHIAPSSTPPSSPSRTSAPVPPSPPSPPSTSSEWTIRYLPPSYVATYANTTATGVEFNRQWSVTEVTARLTSHLSSHEAHHQQKRLDRYVDRLQRRANASAHPLLGASHDDHHKEHKDKDKHHYSDLSSFYLRHAQCRACVQPNLDLLYSTTRVSLASYQPYAVMKFCHNKQPMLPHEQPPSVASNPTPLQDWEGVCIPAQAECPSNTVDLNVLSPSTCAGDVSATKHSCALCVLDGYTWSTHRRAVKGGDNYDGACLATAPASSGIRGKHAPVVVQQLDQCPSVVASARDQRHYIGGSFFLFFAFASGLCCLLAMRRCCMVRAKARAARLTAAQANAVEVPVAEPVSVVAASASQPSSYPGRVAAAREQAREVRQHAVAMQQPLLVSSGLNPPFYPQVSNPPPYAYPYRM